MSHFYLYVAGRLFAVSCYCLLLLLLTDFGFKEARLRLRIRVVADLNLEGQSAHTSSIYRQWLGRWLCCDDG